MLLTLSDLPKVNKWAQAVPYALHSQITAGLFIKPGPIDGNSDSFPKIGSVD